MRIEKHDSKRLVITPTQRTKRFDRKQAGYARNSSGQWRDSARQARHGWNIPVKGNTETAVRLATHGGLGWRLLGSVEGLRAASEDATASEGTSEVPRALDMLPMGAKQCLEVQQCTPPSAPRHAHTTRTRQHTRSHMGDSATRPKVPPLRAAAAKTDAPAHVHVYI